MECEKSYGDGLILKFMRKFAIIITILVMSNCSNSINELDIKLSALIKKYPQLIQSDIKASKFDFKKSIKVVNPNFEIQLYEQNDTLEDPNQIIVIRNSFGKLACFPILSPIHINYWNFKNDLPFPSIKPTFNTFELEYKNAINQLYRNDSSWIATQILDEILTSVLKYKRININDTSILNQDNGYYRSYNRKVPIENDDKCFKRVDKNMQEIINDLSSYSYFIYLSESNNFFIKVKFSKITSQIKIQTYRCNCYKEAIIPIFID